MKRGKYGWRSIIFGGGVQSGHSCLRVILSKPCHCGDAVAQRTPVALHDIEMEMALGSVHDDGTGRLGGAVEHDLPLQLRRQYFFHVVR
jgi:hypothetical protein